MINIKAKEKMVERALLVGAYTEVTGRTEAASLLEELEEPAEGEHRRPQFMGGGGDESIQHEKL